jgi:hypothetical protein
MLPWDVEMVREHFLLQIRESPRRSSIHLCPISSLVGNEDRSYRDERDTDPVGKREPLA